MVRYKLEEFESIGEYYANIFKKTLNIEYVDEFYSIPMETMKEKTGIELKRLQQFADTIDLFRVPTISIREAKLLQFANINSVTELSYRQAARIYYKLKDVDKESYIIILEPPTFSKIEEWIFFAKLMTKRNKSGLFIPMIKLPMVNLDIASELKNYEIYTIQDFLDKLPMLGKNVYKQIHMKKDAYAEMMDMIELLKIEGIDILIAIELFKNGIHNPNQLKQTNIENLYPKLNPIITKGEIGRASCRERV